MDLKFRVQTKVQKPVAEVFNAVYDPKQLSGYFTTGGASGPLKEGTKVIWKFADYPGDVPVDVKRVVPNEVIEFEWAAADGAVDLEKHEAPAASTYNTRVEMTFKALNPNETLVSISEGNWRESPQGLSSSYGNCQGWSQMSCCLKAYVEYGINLRKGAY